jgi:hypothetical protein
VTEASDMECDETVTGTGATKGPTKRMVCMDGEWKEIATTPSTGSASGGREGRSIGPEWDQM